MPNLGCAPNLNKYVGRPVLRKRDGKPGTVTNVEKTFTRGVNFPFKNVYTVVYAAGDEFAFVGDTGELKSFFKPVDGKW